MKVFCFDHCPIQSAFRSVRSAVCKPEKGVMRDISDNSFLIVSVFYELPDLTFIDKKSYLN